MALAPLAGAATSTVKVSDFNAVLTALNAELATLGSRITALEGTTGETEGNISSLQEGLLILENEPDIVLPPNLAERLEALENLVQRVPAENPAPMPGSIEALPRPDGLDPNSVELVYDKATIYYHDTILHALRIGESRWRLFAQLNFVVISPVLWTYDEVIEGTPNEVYQHAARRLMELAELKPQHDAVHQRVREMSEGQP
jgi:hypothetical protein